MAFSARLLLSAGIALTLACSGETPLDEQSLLGADAFQSGSQRCELPHTGAPPAGGTHPDLTRQATVPLSGTPFAVAVSSAGVAYVTQVHAGSAVRADLPSTSLSSPFAVGDLPSQVRMSPDGQTAYVGNQDAQTITYVDVATNQAVGTASVPIGSILTIGLAPDGARLYALMDFYGVYVIDVAARAVIDSIPVERTGSLLTGVAFHPFAPCMYIAARDEGTVGIVDLRNNRVVRTRTVPGARIQNVAVSPDGATLFATDIQRSKVLVWDLTRRNAAVVEYPVGTPVNRNAFDVAVTPDNTQVYVSTLADGNVYVLDRDTRAVLDTIVSGASPRYIGFDAIGATAVIANEFGSVRLDVIQLGSGRPAGRLALGSPAISLALSPDAAVLYVGLVFAGRVVAIDRRTLTIVGGIETGGKPRRIAFDRAGRTAFVANEAGWVDLVV